VREDFLQKVIATSMPFRQSFEHGKYVAPPRLRAPSTCRTALRW
jgi:hypothetical protein